MFKTLIPLLAIPVVSCSQQEGAPVRFEYLEAQLISEVTSIEPGHPFWVALKFNLEDGWHVNWLNPGDAGLAPSIKWTLPPGFTAGEINWPIPQRIPVGDLMLFGYDGTVLLPVEITPPKEFSDNEVRLSAACDWVVCGDVCIPGEAVLSLTLPITKMHAEKNQVHAADFSSSRNSSPVTHSLWKMVASASESEIIIGVVPVSELGPNLMIENLTFFPKLQGIIDNSAEQRLSKDEFVYQLQINRDKMFPNLPEKLEGIVVFQSKPDSSLRAIILEVPLSKKKSF